jgi:rhodanese-related sulfurtransferase
MRKMQATELADYLITAKPFLLDVREPWEFETCSIADSINIPMGQVPQNIERIRDAEECVVICHHGVRSAHAIQFLQQQDCENLVNLEGGVDAWARQVDPDMPVY